MKSFLRNVWKHKTISTSFEEGAVHSLYGNIYYPQYNLHAPMVSAEHEVYNAQGEKMRTFFIRDVHLAHNPFWESHYFIWDRYNYNLKTHFYSHESMLETMGRPEHKYGMLIESESIVPDSYRIFETHKGLEKDFDLIFTYSEELLERVGNARFFPSAAQIWGRPNPCAEKKKNVSMICSNKISCELHKFRYDIAMKCKRECLADTFGTFDGGGYVDELTDILDEYRFNICIENDIKPYYFSERLTTALACKTIPIYMGAEKICDFFNPDGIIMISSTSDIAKVVKRCTKEEYERRLPAVLDNFNRSHKYLNVWDWLWENHLRNVEH